MSSPTGVNGHANGVGPNGPAKVETPA
jgi:hypothetical protein